MHNIATAKVHPTTIRCRPGDHVAFEVDVPFNGGRFMPGNIVKIVGVAECGGCDGLQWFDIGMVHDDSYGICGKCKNIVGIDNIYYLPAYWFRVATDEEVEDYNEYLIQRALHNT